MEKLVDGLQVTVWRYPW